MPGVGSRYIAQRQPGQGLGTPYKFDFGGMRPRINNPGSVRVQRSVVNTLGGLVTKGRPRPPMLWQQRAKSTEVFVVSGVTLTGAGSPLSGVTVNLYNTHTNQWLGQTVSNGSGIWSIVVETNSPLRFAVGYLIGSPDRAGTTRNDLQTTTSVSIYMRDPTVADSAGSFATRVIGSPVVRRIGP